MSVTCGKSVGFSGLWFPPPLQYNWLSQYNWNIVESGIKYHNPHPPLPRINNFELTDFHYDDNVLFQGIEQIKNEVEDPGEQMIDSIHGHGR